MALELKPVPWQQKEKAAKEHVQLADVEVKRGNVTNAAEERKMAVDFYREIAREIGQSKVIIELKEQLPKLEIDSLNAANFFVGNATDRLKQTIESTKNLEVNPDYLSSDYFRFAANYIDVAEKARKELENLQKVRKLKR